MFGKLFGRGKAPTPPPVGDRPDADTDFDAAAKASADIYALLMKWVETDRGVHVESLLTSLGAVAGFACQVAARHGLRSVSAAHWASPWVEVQGADGSRYYFGDAINDSLLEGPFSLWAVAAAVMPQVGDQPPPDIIEIVRHVTSTVGGGGFGAIRFPAESSAGDSPVEYVRHFWPGLQPRLERHLSDHKHWPLAFGLAAQRAVAMTKDVVEPRTALAILMESAVSMSKLDPALVGIAVPNPAVT